MTMAIKQRAHELIEALPDDASMKVTWTARARTRLAEIHDYVAQDS